MNAFGKILKLVAGTFLFFAIIGRLAGAFGYVLVINNSELELMDWAMFGILATIGVVLWAVGFILAKRNPEKETVIPKLDMNDLGFIYTALKKTRNRALGVGIFMGLFGVVMVLVLMSPDSGDVGTGGKVVIWILVVLCLLMAMVLFRNYYKLMDIKGSDAYRLITVEPETITELRIQIVKSGVGKVGQAINANIIVGKKTVTTLAVSETEMELLKQYLKKYNPNLLVDQKVQGA